MTPGLFCEIPPGLQLSGQFLGQFFIFDQDVRTTDLRSESKKTSHTLSFLFTNLRLCRKPEESFDVNGFHELLQDYLLDSARGSFRVADPSE